MKVDDKILEILRKAYDDGEYSLDEWAIARILYPQWDDDGMRSKRGAWIRVIVQAGWRLYAKGLVGYFFISHTRMWCTLQSVGK